MILFKVIILVYDKEIGWNIQGKQSRSVPFSETLQVSDYIIK